MSGKSNQFPPVGKEGRFAKEIVAAMCEHGFMNGFFGDVSPEFQAFQVDCLEAMPHAEWRRWVENNRGNLVNHCGLPWAANL